MTAAANADTLAPLLPSSLALFLSCHLTGKTLESRVQLRHQVSVCFVRSTH